MPDAVATPAAPDAPAVLSQEEITEQAVTLGLEAAAREEAPPVIVEPVEVEKIEVAEVIVEPVVVEEVVPEVVAEVPAVVEVPPVALTEEEQDEADAKSLGFKNQKATAEFKEQRRELRELRPLKAEIEDIKPLADRWTKTYQYLQANNIQPDRFAQGMAMLAGTESQDVAILEKTLGGLEMEADRIRQKLGIGGGSYDPLKEPANLDLARAVENEEMSPAWAQQQARARAEIAHRAGLETRQRETQQQATESTHARQQAMSALDATGAEYAAIDPMYQAKADLLIETLKPVFAELHPSKWDATFRRAYANLKIAAPVAAAPSATVTPLRNQPLRPSAPAGGAQPEVKTEADAFEAAMRAAAAIDGVPYRGTA